jgi:hypothetical protein
VRDGAEALELAQRAVQLTGGDDPVVAATLAAAYAETGDFEAAVRIGRQAADAARGRGMTPLADFIDLQVRGYETGRPFHDVNLRR